MRNCKDCSHCYFHPSEFNDDDYYHIECTHPNLDDKNAIQDLKIKNHLEYIEPRADCPLLSNVDDDVYIYDEFIEEDVDNLIEKFTYKKIKVYNDGDFIGYINNPVEFAKLRLKVISENIPNIKISYFDDNNNEIIAYVDSKTGTINKNGLYDELLKINMNICKLQKSI